MTNVAPIDDSASGVSTGATFVYHRLREAILHLDLEPGLVLSQVQLARQLGVSRTPLREALRMLQHEGLVEGEANRRVRIADLSIRDVEELYSVRIAVEVLGIRLTVPLMTPEDDLFLDRCLEAMALEASRGDVDAWERRHREFHTHLTHAGGRRLDDLLAEYSDLSERCRRVYFSREPRAMSVAASEHEAIVAACRDRDASRAAGELARHLSRTAMTALMTVAPEHEPALIRATLRAVLGD